jgi:hypothetical protein
VSKYRSFHCPLHFSELPDSDDVGSLGYLQASGESLGDMDIRCWMAMSLVGLWVSYSTVFLCRDRMNPFCCTVEVEVAVHAF